MLALLAIRAIIYVIAIIAISSYDSAPRRGSRSWRTTGPRLRISAVDINTLADTNTLHC